MNWLEITVPTTPQALDGLSENLEDLGIEGLVVNDESAVRAFLDNNPTAWDYVDDDVLSSLQGATSLQFYVEDSAEGRTRLSLIRAALPGQNFLVKEVHDEDWLNNWKKYFKPLEIGSHLLIVPEWEPVPENSGRTILRLEPKNAFGNGSHASTRMCLEALESHPAKNVLDLGCGSGILAITALLFGAEHAVCCDMADDAATVCLENAALNGLSPDRLSVRAGDALSPDFLIALTGGRRFDIVFANIIADVIIPLSTHVPRLLAPGGVFICSGIIDGRQDDVRKALADAGLVVTAAKTADDWHMFAAVPVVSEHAL
ncbi:50S ribosomal protein L11 methyltransferase [Oscillospiraceae bacterium CM]|nr:50S ribosomal protein L11 methyltransferase [Oscillospiraceae bacterium CM]